MALENTPFMLYHRNTTRVIFYENENGRMPVREALESLSEPDQAKAAAHLALLEKHGHALREPHVKYLQEKLRELRFKISAGQYRVFFFFQVGEQAVLLHSMVKKTQQTPQRDLELAMKRMKDWTKRNGN
jgi:phage-related protein